MEVVNRGHEEDCTRTDNSMQHNDLLSLLGNISTLMELIAILHPAQHSAGLEVDPQRLLTDFKPVIQILLSTSHNQNMHGGSQDQYMPLPLCTRLEKDAEH